MSYLWRPCTVCTATLNATPKWITEGPLVNGKRILPENEKPEKEWKRFECPRCGSVVYVWPFKMRHMADWFGQ